MPTDRSRTPWLLAAFFLFTGTTHFLFPNVFAGAVPPSLPHRKLLGLLGGAAELASGLGLLLPATRPAARLGLTALLLAVWPANVSMALRPQDFPAIPVWALWLRVPLQLPLLWWVWRAGR